MVFLRRLAVWLANFVLGINLYLLALVVALLFTIGSAAYIKDVLTGSGFYNSFTASTLKLASVQPLDQPNSSTNQKVIGELSPIIQKVVTPTFLKTNIELMIDGFNGWLGKKSASPSLTIDLRQIKSDLNNQVAAYLKAKVASLPVCQNYTDYQAYDPMNATCRPPVNLNQADYQQAATDFLSGLPLLEKQTISFKSLEAKATTPKTAWQSLPTYNKIFRFSPWIFGLISAVGITCIIVFSRSKIRAIKLVGHTFLWSGGMLLVSGALALLFLGKDSNNFVGNGSSAQITFAKELFIPIAHRLVQSFGNWALYFGASYALVGAVCYFVAHRLKLKDLHNQPEQVPLTNG